MADWIKKAKLKEGAFTTKARAKGESVKRYARMSSRSMVTASGGAHPTQRRRSRPTDRLSSPEPLRRWGRRTRSSAGRR